jgi:DHA2 family multidrug resistance protein
LIYRELSVRNPLIALRTLVDRNFRCCCIIIFCAYGVLYANTVSLPALLQSLFGYNATVSGLVLSPAGVFAIAMLVMVGAVLSRGVDARYLMAGGLITMALGNYWMAHLNLEISPWQVVWPRVVLIGGLSMLFAPLNVAAFIYLPKEIRGAAVGLLALLRNEGGSVGTSVAQIVQERREQFHTLRLNESLDRLSRPVRNLLNQGQSFFLQHNGDAVLSHQMALGVLGDSRTNPASSLAYFDVFSVSAAVALMLALVVLLMRRSVAEKGAPIGGE